MSVGIYTELAPSLEAHLINTNDWLLDHQMGEFDKLVPLGCYAEHDDTTDIWQNYVLYAFLSHDGKMLNVGAHYGDEPWDYISHSIYFDGLEPLKYCGANRAIMVAVIRYILLKMS